MDIENVKRSYGRCLNRGDFFDYFYDLFFDSHLDVKKMFVNTDLAEQKKLIRHGLNLIIIYAGGGFTGQIGLQRIQETHNRCNLNIHPDLYPYWRESLLQSVEHFDNTLTDQVKKEWNQVLDKGIQFIVGGYEK